MEIEGYLTKWTNYLSGWKERYFALSNGVFYYSSKKNAPWKGKIHLKVSKISQNEQDPLGIIIDSGTKLLHLRAETISEKMRWLTALKSSKEEIQELDLNLNKIKNSNINSLMLEEFIKKSEVHNEKEEKQEFILEVDRFLKEIVGQEAKLDSTLANLVNKFDFLRDQETFKLIENVVELASGLIKSVTGCYNVFLSERKNILKLLKKIEKNENNDEKLRQLEQKLEDFTTSSQGSIVFDSNELPESNEISQNIDEEQKYEDSKSNLIISPSLIQKNVESTMKINEDYKKFLADLRPLYPIKYKILTENPVFKTRALPLPFHPNHIIPHHKDDESHHLSPLIKSFFGKNFENLPIPIQLHEPLSLLQRSCEQFKNCDLLDKSNENSDSIIRLAYIIAFAFSFYNTTIDRIRKPFTPLLGETYEFIDSNRGFTFYAEQVTDSCFASHCIGKNFTFWNETKIKMVFWGKNIEFTPIGSCHIELKNHNDHFVYIRPIISVENLLTNSPFIDNFGEMTFKNLTTQENARLILQKRGFNNKNAYQADGSIYDKNGNAIYNIKGQWDHSLSIINIKNDEEMVLWTHEEDNRANNPYFFNDFTKELNKLHQENVLTLPLTDSRFRSDQKAMEYGLIDLAIEEHQKIFELERKKKEEKEKFEAKMFERMEINGETCFLLRKR